MNADRTILHKAIPDARCNEWIIISYYVRPGMGECHVNYTTIKALTAEDAMGCFVQSQHSQARRVACMH